MERKGRASRWRVWSARGIAVAADLLQIVLFPLFLPGAVSPWSDALDLAVAGAMTVLLGWHWAFLPSLVAEVVPGLDLVPTWTAAAFFVTRGSGSAAARVPREGAIDAEVVTSRPAEEVEGRKPASSPSGRSAPSPGGRGLG